MGQIDLFSNYLYFVGILISYPLRPAVVIPVRVKLICLQIIYVTKKYLIPCPF